MEVFVVQRVRHIYAELHWKSTSRNRKLGQKKYFQGTLRFAPNPPKKIPVGLLEFVSLYNILSPLDLLVILNLERRQETSLRAFG